MPYLWIFLIVVWLALLVKGADFFVDGAAGIAGKCRISPLVIGLTVVAFGTSMPELAVSVTSAATGSADLSIGNVVGSNIATILLILGVSALICKLPVRRSSLVLDIPVLLPASALLIGLGVWGNALEWWDGLIFLAVLVEGAKYVARAAGMSERIIGLTVVAVGTSLPELVTSVLAAAKKQTDIAVGNIIGSNIFNILFIAGVSALVAPLEFRLTDNLVDALVALAAAVVGIMCATVPMCRRVQGSMDGVYLATRENLAGVRVIRAFCKEQDEEREFAARNASLRREQKRAGRIAALTNPLTYTLVSVAAIALVWVGAIRVDGDLSCRATWWRSTVISPSSLWNSSNLPI